MKSGVWGREVDMKVECSSNSVECENVVHVLWEYLATYIVYTYYVYVWRSYTCT